MRRRAIATAGKDRQYKSVKAAYSDVPLA